MLQSCLNGKRYSSLIIAGICKILATFPLSSMKKVSLLLSTLGGAMGGYLLSNKKLREELIKADDAEDAAKALGKHLQRDGKKIAEQVREFVESEEVQSNLTKAKKFSKQKTDEAKRELTKMVDTGKGKAKAGAKKSVTKAKSAAKKSASKAKTQVKRSATKAKTAAKKGAKRTTTKAKKAATKTARRVKAKTRKLS